MKIFISHSSNNAEYGRALVDLLTGVGVPHESIVFTSDTSYGIPVGNNIFNWLKSQISDKSFVIFLLSPDYYSSVACLNEMGAAWVVENQHAAIFTPDFDLDDPNFRNGALDPREIGFFIDNEDRASEFIVSLRDSFPITDKPALINRNLQKFLESVGSLSSKDGVAGEARGEETVSPLKPDESNDASNKELYVPDPSSDSVDFEDQFLMGLLNENEAHSNEVSEAYLARLGHEDLDEIGDWKSFCELFKLKWTDHGSLIALAALSEEYENNPSVHAYVANGYLHFEDLKKAQTHFRAAIECSDSSIQKLGFLQELACVVQKQSCSEDLFGIVGEMRDLVDSQETENLLLDKLTDLSAWYQEDVLKAAMLERELSLNPANISKRFQLAYLHSQTGNEALAMFHYEKIPTNQRDEAVWNNLGVAYRHFSLKGKAIDAYRKALKKDHTLAMSNLAYEFMGSGFLPEAGEILEEAQKQPSYHDSIPSALVRLKEIPEEEAKIHKEKLKGVSSKSDFLSHVGEYIWQETSDNVYKTMTDPDCELDIKIEGENFIATGTFQKKKSSFDDALISTSIITKTDTETYTVEYRGRFVGKVVVGEWAKKNINTGSPTISLISLAASKRKFIIVIPNGVQKARGMIGDDLISFELGD